MSIKRQEREDMTTHLHNEILFTNKKGTIKHIITFVNLEKRYIVKSFHCVKVVPMDKQKATSCQESLVENEKLCI